MAEYNWICMRCDKKYVTKPGYEYEDGHGGRWIEMCSCGSDLFLK